MAEAAEEGAEEVEAEGAAVGEQAEIRLSCR